MGGEHLSCPRRMWLVGPEKKKNKEERWRGGGGRGRAGSPPVGQKLTFQRGDLLDLSYSSYSKQLGCRRSPRRIGRAQDR